MLSLLTSLTLLVALAALTCGPSSSANGNSPEMLTNPGFEAPFVALPSPTGKAKISGAVAPDWNDNSGWADVTVEYAEEHNDVHGGKSAQRIFAQAVRSGGVQLVHSFALEAKHIYAVSIWVKGTQGAQATLAIRQGGAPYQTYADKATQLNGTWQEVDFQATPDESTPGYLMVYPPIGTSLLIDDASLIDASAAVSDGPAKVGNLLPDSSFEAGFGGGWTGVAGVDTATESAEFEHFDPRPVVDATTAADQKESAKLTLVTRGRATFTSPLIDYNYGRVHTASVWLKSDVSGTGATLSLQGASDSKRVSLTPTWQRYVFSTIVPYGTATRLVVRSDLPSAGTVWIDDAALVEGPDSATKATSPVEITMAINRPGGVFFDGEPATLALATANAPASATVRATCMDLYGHTATLAPVPANALALSIAPDKAHPRGMFKVSAQVYTTAGQAVGPVVQQVFARLPKPREIAPEQSFFGVHIPLAEEYFQLSRAIGARWCRVHDATWVTIWPVVEPKRGEFRFVDTGVDAARKNGMAVLGLLDGGPLWATTKPNPWGGYYSVYNKVDAPGAIDDWREYVGKVVEHYKGRIDHWEVWNEPYGGGFEPGDATAYGNLLKAAYPAAKAANSNAVIVGFCAHPSFASWLDTAMQVAGGTASYDEFSYHDYYGALYGGPRSPSAKYAAGFDAAEQKYGHSTTRWVTESAPGEGVQSLYWPIGKEMDTRVQYAKTIRFDVSLMATGVKHDIYYTLHAGGSYGDMGLNALEHDRTIRPIMAARAVLATLVDGAKYLGRSEPASGVDQYSFRQPEGKLVDVVWSYDNVAHSVPIAKGATVLDALGNDIYANSPLPVGSEPLYIIR